MERGYLFGTSQRPLPELEDVYKEERHDRGALAAKGCSSRPADTTQKVSGRCCVKTFVGSHVNTSSPSASAQRLRHLMEHNGPPCETLTWLSHRRLEVLPLLPVLRTVASSLETGDRLPPALF
eukprot:11833283-Prorocentrum_lima.AAC.1